MTGGIQVTDAVEENHATHKQDELDATARDLFNLVPQITIVQSQNLKAQLRAALEGMYDRTIAEGRYLEFSDPTLVETEAVNVPAITKAKGVGVRNR
jgi:hypothetical protein